MGPTEPADPALSVYVHFPWCLQKCPYCDFASASIRRERVPHEAYAEAVLRELEDRADVLDGRRLVSVFFGGGTPSLWESRALGRVLAAVRAHADADDDLEVTVECNPSSLDGRKAAELASQGVTRLSVGVQSLDAQRLRFLGRLHDAECALQSLREAIPEVPRVSADLMFGMPEQAPEAFVAELERIVALGISHISAYALTVEPATQFGELHRKGKLRLATDDGYADTFLAARRALEARGFEHYEVSNYARPGHTARHNQHYWRGGSYLGLGAGAVGCLATGPGTARRYRNDPRPERYLASERGTREVFEETLGPDELTSEALLLGLRTLEGVSLPALRVRTGRDLRTVSERALTRALERGDCVLDDDRLRVPKARWLHLDSIVARLF